jgi:hypothetical protein
MKKLLFAVLAASLIAPSLADAQHSRSKSKSTTRKSPTRVVQLRNSDDCCWGNRFSFEPYAGALKDVYDISPDDENTAYLVGFRVAYRLSGRTRLLGNIGYSKSDDVASPGGLPSYYVYDNRWIFTTAGGEFDVVPGRTSVSLGLHGGAAWRQTDVDGVVGTPVGPPEFESNYSAQEVVIPGLSLRHRLSSRATVMVGLHDNIFDFLEGPAKHSLALTAGIAFR